MLITLATTALSANLALAQSTGDPESDPPPTAGNETSQSEQTSEVDAQPPEQPPAEPAEDPSAQEVQFLASVLNNPANDRPTRTGAARRLLQLDSDPARAILAEALGSGDAARLLPVIEAMSEPAEPPAKLLEPAVTAIQAAPADVVEPLAILLAKYGDQARQRLADCALDASASTTARSACIRALAQFTTREVGDVLIALINPRRDEPAPIRAAAYDALRRFSGLDLGDTYQPWREWWNEDRDRSREEWAEAVTRRMLDRIGQLERQNADLGRRYGELLRELYRALPLEAQLARLPQDLADPLVSAREFAMARVARLLRDSVPVSPPIQAELRNRLADASAPVRLQAVQLLDEMASPNLAELVAARLPEETDRPVLRAYLDVLANRAHRPALPAILARLQDQELRPAAATAVWGLARQVRLSDDERALAAEALKAVRQPAETASPAVDRALVTVGQEGDSADLIALLDSAEPDHRAAIAEGLVARGMRQPLLDRANDAVIYPYALQSVAAEAPTLSNFRVIIGLAPPEGMTDLWSESVRQLARNADPEPDVIIEADRLLERAPYADARLRQMVLLRAAVLPPDAMLPEQRAQILRRLTPILFELREALRAYELLETMGDLTNYPELATLKFTAALRAGRFENAFEMQPDPSQWIAEMGAIAGPRPELAERIRGEILRRFEGNLSSRQLLALGVNRPEGAPGETPTGSSSDDGSATADGGGSDDRPDSRKPPTR